MLSDLSLFFSPLHLFLVVFCAESDFDGSEITIVLTSLQGEVATQVAFQIPITNDLINEHQETLVGYIEISSAIDEDTITLGRTVTQLIIDDNDGNFCIFCLHTETRFWRTYWAALITVHVGDVVNFRASHKAS